VTAACGGGTSAPKPGTAAVVDYSAGLLAAIFAAYDLVWLIPVIPLVGLAPLTLTTFCGSDPPAMPTFTSAETNALLQLQFGTADFDNGLGKLKDLALNAIWNDACQCTSGALIPPVPPTPPTGTPIFQPPVAPTNDPCRVLANQSTFSNSLSNTFIGFDSYPDLAPTYARITATATITAGAGASMNLGVTPCSASLLNPTPLTGGQIVLPFSGNGSLVLAIPPGLQALRYNGTTVVNSGNSNVVWHTELFCGGIPNAPQDPCCPPDVATQAYLDLILKAVTLIQRQAVPFGYITSTAHAGLSGAGTLDISGLIGVKISITADPTSLGIEGTSPAELFDRGFITWGTPDGYPQSERLVRTNQVSMPARAGAFTSLAYDLHPGVTVTISELIREP